MEKEELSTAEMKERLRCIVRQRWIEASPEEKVRQALLHYLIHDLQYPKGRFSVESMVLVNGQRRRTDILVHDAYGGILLIVECKAPGIAIDEKTLAQIAMYNHALDAPYLILSNGKENHVFLLDKAKKEMKNLSVIPSYTEL